MPRRLKPQKIEEIRHQKYGVTADIMFDRNTDALDFFVTIGNETIRSKDAQQLKRDALKLIEQSSQLEWRPIIHLSTQRQQGMTSGIHVESRRFWLARRHDGRLLEAHWSCDTDDERLRGAQSFHWDFTRQPPFEPPVRPLKYGSRQSEPSIYLPYTEESWAAVELLRERLDGIKQQIEQLINSDRGIAMLQQIGSQAVARMLPTSVGRG